MNGRRNGIGWGVLSRKRLGGCAWVAMFCFASTAAAQLQLVDVEWGFDDAVTPGGFNPVVLHVQNVSGRPIEAVLTLQRSMGAGSEIGAAIVKPVYLMPGQVRAAPFVVYISEYDSQWRLSWGRRPSQRTDVPRYSQKTGPVTVLLQRDDSPARRGLRLPMVRASRFPATLAATDGLAMVLLAEDPGLDLTRAEALVDFVKAGGTVALVRGPADRYPTFNGRLRELSSPLDVHPLGRGHVVKLDATIADLSNAAKVDQLNLGNLTTNPNHSDQTAVIREAFGDLVAVDHNWILIYLVAIGFVLLIGPVHWLTTLRRLDWRLSLGLLLGVVAVTTLVFDLVGRRGVGESTVVHSIGIAKQMEPGVYDVTQHLHLFVAAGGQYPITHASNRNVYSAGQVWEKVPAMIRDGRPGMMQIDIPLYSARGLMHRAKMEGPAFEAKAVAMPEDEGFLKIAVPDDLPTPILKAWAVRDGEHHELQQREGLWVADMRSGPANVADGQAAQAMTYNTWGHPRDNRPIEVRREEKIEQLGKQLLGQLVNRDAVMRRNPWLGATENGRLHLRLLAPAPDAMKLPTDLYPQQHSYLLYDLRVATPEDTP